MIKYYFIIFGIILYLLLNTYNGFSIGILYRIPIGNNPYLTKNSEIRLNDANLESSTPDPNEPFHYLPENNLYLVNGQWYFYTDTDIDLPFVPDDSLIEQIRNSIIQEIANRRKKEKEINAYNKYIEFGLNSLNENEINLLLNTDNPDITLTEEQIDLINSRLINIRYGRIEINISDRDRILNLYNNIDLRLNWQQYINFTQYGLGFIQGNIWTFQINDLLQIFINIVRMQRSNQPIPEIYINIINFLGLDSRLIALILRHSRGLQCAAKLTKK